MTRIHTMTCCEVIGKFCKQKDDKMRILRGESIRLPWNDHNERHFEEDQRHGHRIPII